MWRRNILVYNTSLQFNLLLGRYYTVLVYINTMKTLKRTCLGNEIDQIKWAVGQTSVFSNRSMVYNLKKYILNLSKKNTRFFCTRLTTRVRGSNSSLFFVAVTSWMFLLYCFYTDCLSCFVIARSSANSKIVNLIKKKQC